MADKAIPMYVQQLVAHAAINTLLDNKIEVVPLPVGVEVHPAFISFPLELADAKNIKDALSLQAQIKFNIARALGLSHKESKEVVVRNQSTFLIVEVERNEPYKPSYAEIAKEHHEGLLFGKAHFETLTSNPWAKEEAGIAFIGTTGSGKTNAIRLATCQALGMGIRTYLIDYKGGDDFIDDIAPLCEAYAFEEAEALPLLKRLHAIIKARNEGQESKDERLLIVFDELPQASDEAQNTYAKMCAIMRSANVRTFAGSQRFGNEVKNGIKTNLTTRLVGKVSDKNESHLATGVKGAGAELLTGLGDMLLVANHRIRRIQVPRANRDDMRPVLEKSPFAPQQEASKKVSTPTKKGFSMEDAREFARVSISQRKGNKPKLPEMWAFYYALRYYSINEKWPTPHYFNKERKRRLRQGLEAACVTDSQVGHIHSAMNEYLRHNLRQKSG